MKETSSYHLVQHIKVIDFILKRRHYKYHNTEDCEEKKKLLSYLHVKVQFAKQFRQSTREMADQQQIIINCESLIKLDHKIVNSICLLKPDIHKRY